MARKRKHPPNPLPCGCRVGGAVYLPSQRDDVHVVHCPLHGAAQRMLTTLEHIADFAGDVSDEHLRGVARAARDKARGTA